MKIGVDIVFQVLILHMPLGYVIVRRYMLLRYYPAK